MKKMVLSVLMVLLSVSFMACKGKTTVVREVVPAQENPAIKVKINDGSGSGIDVNIPTKK